MPPTRTGILIWLRVAFVLAYPVALLVSHAHGIDWLRPLLLPLAVVLIAGPALLLGSGPAWAAFAAASGISAAVLVWPALSLWPPVLVTAILAAWFGLSLLPGREPVLLGFARRIHQDLDTPVPGRVPQWLRAWTGIWAGFMVAASSLLAVLALSESLVAWTVATLAVPAVSGVLLVMEWYLRKRLVTEIPPMSLSVFLRSVARVYGTGRTG